MSTRKPRVVTIIPARIGSTRLPRKVLLQIDGKPMIQHIYENAKSSKLVDKVYIATDSEEVKKATESFGGKCIMTPVEGIFSGSDRVAWAARTIEHDIVVNLQGDEPFMTGKMIDEAIRPMIQDNDLKVCTMCREITRKEEIDDPGVVKCVRDKDGNGLYFSRAKIPYPRSPAGLKYYEHLGIYVYRKDFLQQFIAWEPTPLEKTESLEMLRMIEHGIRLRVVETKEDTTYYMSVDTQADLEKANRYFKARIKKGGTKSS